MSSHSGQSDGAVGWIKWAVITIIGLLAAGSGIVALLNYINPSPTSKPVPAPVVCMIVGNVFNNDDNKPISNVRVSYYRNIQGESVEDQIARSRLGTTDTSGYFEADCSTIELENFPLQISVSGPNWGSGYCPTVERVQLGQKRTKLTIYVSDKNLRNVKCSFPIGIHK